MWLTDDVSVLDMFQSTHPVAMHVFLVFNLPSPHMYVCVDVYVHINYENTHNIRCTCFQDSENSLTFTQKNGIHTIRTPPPL